MGAITDLEPGEGLVLPDGRLVRRDAVTGDLVVYADDDADDLDIAHPPMR